MAALSELGLANPGALSRPDALAIGRRAGARWLIHGGYQRVNAQIDHPARRGLQSRRGANRSTTDAPLVWTHRGCTVYIDMVVVIWVYA